MYWLADSEQRILGPMGLDAVRELVLSGRMTDIANVSRDGRSWQPVANSPEVLSLLAERTPEVVAATQAKQAEKVREYLARIQTQQAHEIFRVPPGATVEQYRAAFFSTVKKFYPDRQPEGELRRACENVFLFLAALLLRVERSQPAAAAPTATTPRPPAPLLRPAMERTPRPSAPPSSPGRTLRSAREQPTYEPVEFVGLRWKEDRVEARMKVGRKHVPMFTSHPLANFASDSLFVPGATIVPLGTTVELTLEFEERGVEIQARGKVFWENSQDPRQPTGFGVRLFTLDRKDRDFIRGYIALA